MKQLRRTLAWLAWRIGALSLLRQIVNRYEIKRSRSSQPQLPFLKNRRNRAMQILVYHRVNDERDPFFPAIRLADFRKQMELIAEEYHPYSLEDAIESLETDAIPDNAVVVTFDDGYRDNFQNAFPILRQLGIPAIIFLATDVIGSGKCLWHDVVFSAFRTTTMSWLKGFPEEGSIYSLKNDSDRLSAQRQVLEFLCSLREDERGRRIDQLVDGLKVQRCSEQDLMLSWNEIRTMHKHGISFGSHTATHPILSTLPDVRLRSEIIESKRVIEEQLDCKVNAFAYPVGRPQDFDQRAKAVLKEHGYRCAVTTIFGVNNSRDDLFELKRGTPWEPDLPSFAMKLAWYKFAQVH
jgi:peptidoglycan/xylan/chitin deacetylase (PgdA/CDA1 family)